MPFTQFSWFCVSFLMRVHGWQQGAIGGERMQSRVELMDKVTGGWAPQLVILQPKTPHLTHIPKIPRPGPFPPGFFLTQPGRSRPESQPGPISTGPVTARPLFRSLLDSPVLPGPSLGVGDHPTTS